jgi:hypothetical protein
MENFQKVTTRSPTRIRPGHVISEKYRRASFSGNAEVEDWRHARSNSGQFSCMADPSALLQSQPKSYDEPSPNFSRASLVLERPQSGALLNESQRIKGNFSLKNIFDSTNPDPIPSPAQTPGSVKIDPLSFYANSARFNSLEIINPKRSGALSPHHQEQFNLKSDHTHNPSDPNPRGRKNPFQNKNDKNLESSDDSASSCNFEFTTTEKIEVFKKNPVSIYVFILHILLIATFLIEFRNTDIRIVYEALTPIILNRFYNTSTTDVPHNFDSIKSTEEAVLYTFDRIGFVYNNNQLKPDRSYFRSAFFDNTPKDYEFKNLNFMQIYNILYGVRLKLCGTNAGGIPVNQTYYYNPYFNYTEFLQYDYTVMQDFFVKKGVGDEDVRKIILDIIYYNPNLEVMINYSMDFEIRPNSGFVKKLEVLEFLPKMEAVNSRYRMYWILVRVIRTSYFIYFGYFLIYFGMYVQKKIRLSMKKSRVGVNTKIVLGLIYIFGNLWYIIFILFNGHVLVYSSDIDNPR